MRLDQPWLVLHNLWPRQPKRATLAQESRSVIAFPAGTSCGNIPEWGQHSFNRTMPCIIISVHTFRGTWAQPNDDPGAPFKHWSDIFSNIPSCEIPRPGMLIAWKLGHLSLVRCTNDWNKHYSGRNLNMRNAPPTAVVHFSVYSVTVGFCKAHWFAIEVHMNGRCTTRTRIHLKLTLKYNIPKIDEWSSLQPSSPSTISSSERSFWRDSPNWNDSILKLSSPHRRCWCIHVSVCWLNDWACWKSCADQKGCYGIHCSEYLRCLLFNPVALPYALPPLWSTPTCCQWAFILVGSWVHVRSGFWGSSVWSTGACSGGGVQRTLYIISRSSVD